MNLRTLMVINSIVAVIFGLGFVFIPWQFYSFYGIEASPQLNLMGQLFGGALITFAVLTWTARGASDSDARKSIILAMLVGDTIGFIVSLIAQFGNVVNNFGWSTVIIYLLLAIGFGYFQFKKTA